MKNLKIEDFYRLKFLSDIQTYGKKLFFVVTLPDKKTNDYKSKIWMYDNKLLEFTSGFKDSSPRVSPNGKYLAFVSKRKENKSQLLIMPLNGGEAKILAEGPDFSDLQWSPDSKSIYYISNESVGEESDIRIIKRYPFYFDGKGFIYDKRPSLFNITLNGKIKKITSEPYNVLSFSISPDGDKITLVMRKDDQNLYWNNLFLMEMNKLKKIEIEGSFSSPVFSQKGDLIGVIYSDNKKSIFQHHKICIYNINNENFECVTSEIDRDIGNYVNSDSRYGSGKQIEFIGNRIYFIVTDGGSSKLYYYQLGDKNYLYLDTGESIDSFSVMDNGLAYISQTSNRPTEVFIYNENTKRIKRITKFNKYFESLPQAKKFSFNASDGEKIEFWFLSKDWKIKPTVLEIHGGPKTADGNGFVFEYQVLANSGFNVIFSNPRGSNGYIEEFFLKIKGHYGSRDYEDLMEIVEHASKLLPVDKTKLGAIGRSYGGFMVNWIIGHTDIFKAAISERSITNFISYFGTCDIGPSFIGDQIGKDPWELFQHYWESSPIKYVKYIKTPVLIIHSDEDFRCPIEQAYQFFTALNYFNKNVEMVIFVGENHGLSRYGKPKHRVERLNLIVDYMKKYLKEKGTKI